MNIKNILLFFTCLCLISPSWATCHMQSTQYQLCQPIPSYKSCPNIPTKSKFFSSEKKTNQQFMYRHIHRHVKHTGLITATTTPGTIRDNVEHIAHQYGWQQVIWSSCKNFRWVSKTRITAPDLKGIMRKLLEGYPLQAVFYNGNHVLVIRPRTLK